MWHFHHWREHARADDGFSLVEVLIGAFISMLALVGLAQTLIAATASQGSSELSVAASQLATQEIEKIQSLNWDLVTLYDADAPSPKPSTDVIDGATLYLVWSAATPPPATRPLYTQTIELNGTDYTVDTRIAWDDSSGPTPATPPAGTAATEGTRKRIRVQVSWPNRGTIRTVTASSLRSWPPVQRGPSLFYLLETTAGPSQQFIDENGYPASTLVNGIPVSVVTLGAVTNRQAGGVAASWVNRAGGAASVTLADVSAGAGQSPGLVWEAMVGAPTYTFANGATSFQVTATPPAGSAYPTDTRTVSVTFLHNSVYVVPGSISTSGIFCKHPATNRLKYPVDLNFHVQGFQASDRATITWLSGVSAGTPTVLHVSSSERGTWQRVTLPANSNSVVLTGGTITFTIVVNRTSALPLAGLPQLPVTYNVSTDAPGASC